MTINLAVTEAIESINEAESRFNFSRTTDLQFFSEWQENLPELTQAERETLDRIKNSYSVFQVNVVPQLKYISAKK